MLKRYMHNRERYFAMLNDNRVVRPFEWGTEFIGAKDDSGDPRKLFADFAARTLAESDEFFSAADRPTVVESGGEPPFSVRWESAVSTPSPENNTAYAAYFPHREDRKKAVIVLPHWNAKAGTFFDLCRFFN